MASMLAWSMSKKHFTSTTDILLCRVKSQGEVVPPILRVESVEVKCLRVVVVDKGAKSHSIVPASGKVGHIHVLLFWRKKIIINNTYGTYTAQCTSKI